MNILGHKSHMLWYIKENIIPVIRYKLITLENLMAIFLERTYEKYLAVINNKSICISKYITSIIAL